MGDITADKYVNENSVKYGGAALNMAMWAKRVGVTPMIVSAVGSDQIGAQFLKFLEDEKLADTCVAKREGSTSSIEIFLENGERRYGTWDPGVLAGYHVRQEDQKALADMDGIVLTVYPAYQNILDEFSAWKKTLHPEDRPLFVVNYGDLKEFGSSTDIAKRYVDLTDILVFGLDKEKDVHLLTDAQALVRPGKIVITTLGKHGSVAYIGSETFVQPALDAQVVDTTGAGDSFLVGFLASYLSQGNCADALKAGSKLAVQAIGTLGAY